MLGFPLGILSAAGASVGFDSDYELISTTVLGTASSSVVFSSLGDYSGTYKHLQIRSAERHSVASLDGAGKITINAADGVETHFLLGTGTSAFTGRDQPLLIFAAGSTATANNFGVRIYDFFDCFNTTTNKTVKHFWGFVNSGLNRAGYQSGLWESTASVTSITLNSDSTFVAGTRFSIYGIKG